LQKIKPTLQQRHRQYLPAKRPQAARLIQLPNKPGSAAIFAGLPTSSEKYQKFITYFLSKTGRQQLSKAIDLVYFAVA